MKRMTMARDIQRGTKRFCNTGVRPWSKLQTRLYGLMDRNTNFQIHCSAVRMPSSQSSTPTIPRYWITEGKGKTKQTIWEYKPQRNYAWIDDAPAISDLIEAYIQTSRHDVRTQEWNDPTGLIPVLLRFDRRFGKKAC